MTELHQIFISGNSILMTKFSALFIIDRWERKKTVKGVKKEENDIGKVFYLT